MLHSVRDWSQHTQQWWSQLFAGTPDAAEDVSTTDNNEGDTQKFPLAFLCGFCSRRGSTRETVATDYHVFAEPAMVTVAEESAVPTCNAASTDIRQ